MSLQANLKADSTTKTLIQRCQDLVKIIDDYPAKVTRLSLSNISRFHVDRCETYVRALAAVVQVQRDVLTCFIRLFDKNIIIADIDTKAHEQLNLLAAQRSGLDHRIIG